MEGFLFDSIFNDVSEDAMVEINDLSDVNNAIERLKVSDTMTLTYLYIHHYVIRTHSLTVIVSAISILISLFPCLCIVSLSVFGALSRCECVLYMCVCICVCA